MLPLLLIGCSTEKTTDADKKLLNEAQSFFQEIPLSLIDEEKERAKISLGKKLYLEKKLSLNDSISCNSCHQLDKFGVDNEATSPGHDGIRGNRNSPTVYNASLNKTQFWDGRAKDLAEQALGPILNPIEHGMKSDKDALEKINTPAYLSMFKEAFPNDKLSFTYANTGKAIEAFEKTLLTRTRFDDYLGGEVHALTKTERLGLQKFMQVGCTTCHNGAGLGGNSFQKMGLVKKYKTKDLGRYEVTGKRRDKYKFKVPILRNITKTGPYLHDGSIKSLEEVIGIMAEYQIGKVITKKEVKDIKAFLVALEAKESELIKLK